MGTEDFDKPGKLLRETTLLLQSDKRTLIQLHIETGLPYFWLKSLIDEKTKNPSVNRIEYLNAILKEQQLAK
jgi:hypothetical protein